MSIEQHPGGEPVDIDQLTASNINDDQLDAIRAELKHYRARETASPEALHLAGNVPRRKSTGA